MKKYIKHLSLVFILGLYFTACQDPFELVPSDIISEDVVFDDENLVDAFLADIYARAMFETSGGQANYDQNIINAYGGEARNFAPWQAPFGTVIGPIYDENGARALTYWPYQAIREINVFLF